MRKKKAMTRKKPTTRKKKPAPLETDWSIPPGGHDADPLPTKKLYTWMSTQQPDGSYTKPVKVGEQDVPVHDTEEQNDVNHLRNTMIFMFDLTVDHMDIFAVRADLKRLFGYWVDNKMDNDEAIKEYRDLMRRHFSDMNMEQLLNVFKDDAERYSRDVLQKRYTDHWQAKMGEDLNHCMSRLRGEP